MKIDKIITDDFKNRIKKAVQAAEKKSGGEIVVFLSPESGGYRGVYWQAGFLTVYLAAFVLIFLFKFFPFVGAHVFFFSGIVFLLPLIVTGLLFLIGPLRLLLINKNIIDYHVHLRAKEAFLNQEVFNTRDRTGVLIYISLFERKVVVLGDSGINKKVSADAWDSVIQAIIAGIGEHSLLHGIVSGITLCGNLLKVKKVKRRAGDKNELDDNLRIGGKK